MKDLWKQWEEKRNKIATRKLENNKEATVSPSLSVIALNINELNSPITRYRVAEWEKRKMYTSTRDSP